MKTAIISFTLITAAIAGDTAELLELARKPSNYESGKSAQALYNQKKDLETERWVQWGEAPDRVGRAQSTKVIRRIVEGGALVETRKGTDVDKPHVLDFIEITHSVKDVGWRRWRLQPNKDRRWVLVSTWEGTGIRWGFIHWKVIAELDGWGSADHWQKGKVAQWVHERVNDEGYPVLAYSDPIGDTYETGIIYYSGSGISPPHR